MWGMNESFLSIMTPKNVVLSTYFIPLLLFNLIVCCGLLYKDYFVKSITTRKVDKTTFKKFDM